MAADLDPRELEEFGEFWKKVSADYQRNQADLRERQQRLLELRLKGHSVSEIAKACGVTHQLLYGLLNRAGNSTRPRAKRAVTGEEDHEHRNAGDDTE